jgi:hypothetical protein
MDMNKNLGLDALPSLARRIQEAENSRAEHLRQLRELDTLLGSLWSQFKEITNRAAPVASLPNEILSAIFEAGCLLPRLQKPEPSFEILVSQVSRRWRDVAIGTPSLWTNVVVSNSGSACFAEAYLMRSGTLPLDLQVDISYNPLMKLATGIIAPHASRWRRLCLRCQHICAIFEWFHSIFASRLEFLQISLAEGIADDGEELSEASRVFVGGTPSLQTLRLQGIGLQHCTPQSATLTTLHLHTLWRAYKPPNFCEMLSNLPVLVHLVIHGGVVDDDMDTTTTAFATLSALRTIHLFSNRASLAEVSLLSFISAPLLECLVLEEVDAEQIKTLSGHPSWPTPSPRYPRLSSLSVAPYRAEIDESPWLQLSHLFPTIKELTVLDDDPCDFFTTLLQSDPLEAPWPHLQALSLSELKDIHVPSLGSMLFGRIAQGLPLQKLQLSKTSLTSTEGVDSFSEIRRNVVVEEFEPKRWPPGNFNLWYDGD